MAKHGKTLASIFEKPTRANVRWSDFVSLIENLGGVVKPAGGKGSRFNVSLNGHRMTPHRPHPGEEMAKVLVEDLREFLAKAGVAPQPKSAKPHNKTDSETDASSTKKSM